jgi:hypothetical protein
VYVVGQKQCGKTTMMHSAVGRGAPQKAGSELVDVWCIRKPNPGERSETACVWELPGDDAVSQALSAKDKVCMHDVILHADSNASALTCILPACKGDQHGSCHHNGGLVETVVSCGELHHMDPAGDSCFERTVPSSGEEGELSAHPDQGKCALGVVLLRMPPE